MDRIRSLSEQVLKRYPGVFGSDFEKNKEELERLAIIPSKQMRNHIAGYIARLLREPKPEEEQVEEVAAE